jgi:hypothetical protein
LWKEQRKLYWISSRGFALGLSVFIFHYLHPSLESAIPLLSTVNQSQLEATSIFTTALLTFALIAVYRDIGETQASQANTQQNQEELLEIERRPYVEVVSYEFVTSVEEQNKLRISNHGQGVALELSVVTKVDFPARDGLGPGVCVKPISRLDDPNQERQDRSIPAKRVEVGFDAKACIGLEEDGTNESNPIPHGFAKMRRAEVERCTFQLYVMYYNVLGEVGLSKITTPRSINLQKLNHDKQIFYLGDMIHYSKPIRILDSDINFEELDSDDMVDPESNASVEPNIIQSE